MRIKNVEAIPLVRDLEEVFKGGTYKITSRNTIVTRVELDNGVVGEIFGGDEDQYHFEICRLVNSIYRGLLVGEDVRDVESHWQRMWETRVDLNNRGIHALDMAKHCAQTQAIAAVDMALWDALGKSLNQPVYKLLGGFRDQVPVIAIGGYYLKGGKLADLEEEVGHYKEQQVALHLLAGIPHGLCVEIFPNYKRDPMWFDFPVERPVIREGNMLLPERAGFGIDLKSDTIERWAQRVE